MQSVCNEVAEKLYPLRESECTTSKDSRDSGLYVLLKGSRQCNMPGLCGYFICAVSNTHLWSDQNVFVALDLVQYPVWIDLEVLRLCSVYR